VLVSKCPAESKAEESQGSKKKEATPWCNYKAKNESLLLNVCQSCHAKTICRIMVLHSSCLGSGA
jgi:hypothetical protein